MEEGNIKALKAQSTRCKVRSLPICLYRRTRMRARADKAMTGVMRFLQIEWHNHERARNSWDIERAEMKAKIAKQEGELRHTKKLNDLREKHLHMLETALKDERAKKSNPEPEARGVESQQDKKAPEAAPKTSGRKEMYGKRMSMIFFYHRPG